MNNILDLLGRIFISSVFLLSGYNKIFNFESTTDWMSGFGLPGFLLWPAILLEVIFPIFIIIGYKTKISAYLLALFCISTALIFHLDFSVERLIWDTRFKLAPFRTGIFVSIRWCNLFGFFSAFLNLFLWSISSSSSQTEAFTGLYFEPEQNLDEIMFLACEKRPSFFLSFSVFSPSSSS